MRIYGINIYTNNKQSSIHNSGKNNYLTQSLTHTDGGYRLPYYPVFMANPISTHREFRKLCKNHEIRCIYCNQIMIWGVELQKMLKSGVFSGPVKDFVETVNPYRKYMKKGQQTVFDRITKYSQKSPQTHLSEIIQYLYQNSIKGLVKSQSKIFKLLVEEANNLPADIQPVFRKFMKIQHKRLYEIPYLEQFNPETYSYKINKMIQSIPNEELKSYIQKITVPLSQPEFKDINAAIPQEIAVKISKSKADKLKTSEDICRYVIYRVGKIGERLDRQDIVRLCETSKNMLDNKPVVITFSNKEFMKDLVNNVLAPIRKTPEYFRMINIANKLPSSDRSKNSFIVKHRYSNSDTIGYKLLDSSISTVEHEKPRSEGGIDDLTNCVLACKADNAERGTTPQYLYLRTWASKNPQRYFDDVIQIANEEQLLKPSDIRGQADTLFKEGHVKVNLSRLKEEDL